MLAIPQGSRLYDAAANLHLSRCSGYTTTSTRRCRAYAEDSVRTHREAAGYKAIHVLASFVAISTTQAARYAHVSGSATPRERY